MGRPRKQPNEMMVAADTATIEIKGVPFPIVRGVTRVRRNDVLVQAAPQLWKPIESSYPEVEQATQAPGEQRG